ncbi:dioxygenase family protein [Muricoccus pecuniae]|uniref:Catechol 1,2-dioxygenase n=1 Tax=Muricoccus pecuniae TaxID=693023 RepID=A0A840YM79_9PROT|nr:dioxygenase [Roseomonas pecuniae]MBB5696392.1 catechol 1,2-dioxygenase [Roseomonas pecuniae]
MNEFCQRAIAAMDPGAPGADPALQRQVAVVLKHLHAMLDELRTDDADLYRFMAWLERVGRDGDFVMLCDLLGLTMRSVQLTHGVEGATPPNVLGPFPKDDVPVQPNPVLLAGPDEAGERVELRGTVRSADGGASIPGARLVIWQTNHAGKYENEDPDQVPDNFRARFVADQDGHFSISTILPGPYEIGSLHSAVGEMMAKLGRHRLRAPHLHYKVEAPSFRPLVSQIYFEGQPSNETDCIFSPHPAITVRPEAHPDRPGQLLARYDIFLAAA